MRGCAGHAAPGGYLTLRRLVVWLAEPLVRMRGLAGIADATGHLEGGELVNAVGALAQHGDALVQHFVSRVMEQMCQPLFHMVTEWVFSGRLSNAGHEFFISSSGKPTGWHIPCNSKIDEVTFYHCTGHLILCPCSKISLYSSAVYASMHIRLVHNQLASNNKQALLQQLWLCRVYR